MHKLQLPSIDAKRYSNIANNTIDEENEKLQNYDKRISEYFVHKPKKAQRGYNGSMSPMNKININVGQQLNTARNERNLQDYQFNECDQIIPQNKPSGSFQSLTQLE